MRRRSAGSRARTISPSSPSASRTPTRFDGVDAKRAARASAASGVPPPPGDAGRRSAEAQSQVLERVAKRARDDLREAHDEQPAGELGACRGPFSALAVDWGIADRLAKKWFDTQLFGFITIGRYYSVVASTKARSDMKLLLIPSTISRSSSPEYTVTLSARRRRGGPRPPGPRARRRVRLGRRRGRGGREDAASPAARPRPRSRASSAARAGAARTDGDGNLRVEVTASPTPCPTDERTEELEREYRAVVEEILELRGAGPRIRAFLRSISEPGALADTSGYSPDLSFEQKLELLRRSTSPSASRRRWSCSASGSPSCRFARRIRDDVESGAEAAAARVLPAQADGVDPQGAGRGRRLRRRRVPQARSRRPGCPRTSASRPSGARAARADGRGERRVLDDPHLPRLADRRAVGRALRRAARPGRRPRGARRRPRRPRGRQGPDHRVHRGARRCARSAGCRGGQGRRSDPHPDRPSRHRQDLDRRVDRPRDRARVRPHVARRRPRRGRDPRPPPHLHRRPSGPPGAGAARRRDDEPGDPARRGRQGRRRLARRPQLGPARGARPGPEPLLPRSLPRRRARPLAGPVHRHRERRRDDPRAAARPHGGRRLRRLHDRGEGRDRPWLPAGRDSWSETACARTRSRSPTS